jgi:uncharacterized protein
MRTNSVSGTERAAAGRDATPTIGAVLATLCQGLGPELDVLFAYLFGSVAKGCARSQSDVDVGVWLSADESVCSEEAPRALCLAERALELEGSLEAKLRRRVQVVVLNTAPIELAHNVLRHGILVCSRDEGARVRFYVEHGRRYYDLEPAREIFDRAMERRIVEGRFGG